MVWRVLAFASMQGFLKARIWCEYGRPHHNEAPCLEEILRNQGSGGAQICNRTMPAGGFCFRVLAGVQLVDSFKLLIHKGFERNGMHI